MSQSPSLPILASARAHERLGALIADRWRLESVLGVGGMGAVFEARHRNGKRVAIKILHPELALNGDVLRRFLREGHLANAVEHPGVVSVLDDGVTDDGLPFLVMELLDGESLDARLERLGRPLALADALSVAVAMLSVLEAAHSKGIVHRDLKPENVFLTGSGGVKLLDFGIAFLLDTMGGTGMVSTRSGIMVGTPTFMPREQAQGRTRLVDGQSDLWSVGATVFYALTRDFLYDVSTVSDFVEHLMTEPPRTLHSLAPDVPASIAAVIDQALEHDRDWRWKSATEMRHALEAAAAEAGITIPSSPSLDGYTAPVPLRNSLTSLPDSMAPASMDGRQPVRRSSPESITLEATPSDPALQPPTAASSMTSAPGMTIREPAKPPARSGRLLWLGLLGVAGLGGLGLLIPRSAGHHHPTAPAAVSPPPTTEPAAPRPTQPTATATAPEPSPATAPPASASAQPSASSPRPQAPPRLVASAPARAAAPAAAPTAPPAPAKAPGNAGGDDLGLSRD